MTVQNKLVRTIIAVCLTAVVFSGCFPTSDEKNSKDDNSSKTVTTTDSEKGLGDDSTSDQNKNDESEYLEVTVSDGSILYENESIELDELKEIISDKKVTQIKIIDDNASQKAYKELTDYLTDNHINYFSDSE